MAVSVVHSTVATLPDEPGAEVNAGEWNAAHTVTGLGTFADQDYASPPAIGGTTPAAVTATTLIATTTPTTLGNGSAASHVLASNLSGANDPTITFSNNSVAFGGFSSGGVTLNASGADVGASGLYAWTGRGSLRATADGVYQLANNAATGFSTFNYAPAGAATSRCEIQKTTTGIADATPTTVLTFTIPNTAQTASFLVHANVAIGAGGAVGANEAANALLGIVTITRTAGVNAVAAYVQLGTTGSTAVAGATTCAIVGAMGAVVGAVGASNTLPFTLTITKGGGASANHVAMVHCTLINMNSTGITVA